MVTHLLRFGTLFHKTLGYHHQMTRSQNLSLLSSTSPVPHLATPAPLTRTCFNLCTIQSISVVTVLKIWKADGFGRIREKIRGLGLGFGFPTKAL